MSKQQQQQAQAGSGEKSEEGISKAEIEAQKQTLKGNSPDSEIAASRGMGGGPLMPTETEKVRRHRHNERRGTR